MNQVAMRALVLVSFIAASTFANARTVTLNYTGVVSGLSLVTDLQAEEPVFNDAFETAEFATGDVFRLSMRIEERTAKDADTLSPPTATYRSSPATYEASVGAYRFAGEFADFTTSSADPVNSEVEGGIIVGIFPESGHVTSGGEAVAGLELDSFRLSVFDSIGSTLDDGLNLSAENLQGLEDAFFADGQLMWSSASDAVLQLNLDRVSLDVAAVPLPPAVWLLLSAGVGTGLVFRRKRGAPAGRRTAS